MKFKNLSIISFLTIVLSITGGTVGGYLGSRYLLGNDPTIQRIPRLQSYVDLDGETYYYKIVNKKLSKNQDYPGLSVLFEWYDKDEYGDIEPNGYRTQYFFKEGTNKLDIYSYEGKPIGFNPTGVWKETDIDMGVWEKVKGKDMVKVTSSEDPYLLPLIPKFRKEQS